MIENLMNEIRTLVKKILKWISSNNFLKKEIIFL
jgi:hypothetical protein